MKGCFGKTKRRGKIINFLGELGNGRTEIENRREVSPKGNNPSKNLAFYECHFYASWLEKLD